MPDELKEAIEKNARGPKSVKGDVGEIEQHSLTEQIEADRYLASREARSKPHKALRFAKLSPPGADYVRGGQGARMAEKDGWAD